jgi:hypothetical protein
MSPGPVVWRDYLTLNEMKTFGSSEFKWSWFTSKSIVTVFAWKNWHMFTTAACRLEVTFLTVCGKGPLKTC